MGPLRIRCWPLRRRLVSQPLLLRRYAFPASRYAEFYKELGLAELGYLVHCNRDHAMTEGFNSDLTLARTQTVIEGAPHCDFRFSKKF
jgi:hypothetical protein